MPNISRAQKAKAAPRDGFVSPLTLTNLFIKDSGQWDSYNTTYEIHFENVFIFRMWHQLLPFLQHWCWKKLVKLLYRLASDPYRSRSFAHWSLFEKRRILQRILWSWDLLAQCPFLALVSVPIVSLDHPTDSVSTPATTAAPQSHPSTPQDRASDSLGKTSPDPEQPLTAT